MECRTPRLYDVGQKVPDCVDRAARRPDRDRQCPGLPLGALEVPAMQETGYIEQPVSSTAGGVEVAPSSTGRYRRIEPAYPEAIGIGASSRESHRCR
jgi:hypothetical protein